MEPTSAISMTMHLLISTILLSSFASEAAVPEDSKLANADDFFVSSLHAREYPVPKYKVADHTLVDATKIRALKSIDMSMVRIDFDPLGYTPIHLHPQSSELLNVLEGTVYVGFLIPDQMDRRKSQLVSKILNPGDVFVVPQGRMHFLYNVGHNTSAALFNYFNNMDYYLPAIIPNPFFASDPPIDDDFLAKNFQLDKSVIEHLRKKFS